MYNLENNLVIYGWTGVVRLYYIHTTIPKLYIM